MDLPSIALGGSKLAAFISPASCTVVGLPDATSNPLACTSSFCVSAMNEAENGLSSIRKLPAVGLPYFSSTSTVWIALFLAKPSYLTVGGQTADGDIQIMKWSITRLWLLGAEIGATVLAAVAFGSWAVRRKM